jgi:hypothetical protein
LRSGDTKPGYKLYLKSSSGYTNYNNETVKPTVQVVRNASSKANTLQITNTAQSGNKVIVLLADKSGTGAVDYMATATLSSSGIATVNIPSGVNVANYTITTLYASSLTNTNTADSLLTEAITGSYVCDSTTIANPTDYEMTYTGEGFSATTAFNTATWYSVSDYSATSGDPNVTVTFTPITAGISLNSNSQPYLVGDYTATFTLHNGKKWSDGSSGTISTTFTITQKELTVDIISDASSPSGYAATITGGITSADSTAPPTVQLLYTKSDNSYSSTTYPPSRGTYTMSVILDSSNTVCKNYVINNSPTLYQRCG